MRELILIALIASATHAAETVGTWELESPDSAIFYTSFFHNYWLNTTNDPISPNEAFTGPGMLERGWANLTEGQGLDFVFNSGVLNVAGNDLVMLDARFDDGEYFISSSYDGFSSSILLSDIMFTDTNETRSYHFGQNNAGPFEADIWGAAFDLSALGVSEGESVSVIRVTAASNQTDPIGLGRVVPAPSTSLICIAGIMPLTRRRRVPSF